MMHLAACHYHTSRSTFASPSSSTPSADGTLEFNLADIGEGIAECEIIRWFVAPGDRIAQFDKVCEVQSDKANVEITSRYDGTVKELRYKVGELAKVGQPLMILQVDGAGGGSGAVGGGDSALPKQEEKQRLEGGKNAHDYTKPVVEGGDTSEEALLAAGYPLSSVPSQHLTSVDDSELAAAALDEQRHTASSEEVHVSFGRVQTSPAVRRIAKENGVDLTRVKGTGPQGRILKDDVFRYTQQPSRQTAQPGATTATRAADSQSTPTASRPASAPSVSSYSPPAALGLNAADRFPTTTITPPHSPSTSPPAVPAYLTADQTIPISGLQRIMVQTMTTANAIPHFTFGDEVSVDALAELRESLKPAMAAQGVKLSFMPFLIKALSLALRSYPQLNAHTNADCTQLTHRAHHNIGIAMDTPKGLLVPNVKHVQQLSVTDIARELQRLQALGKAGRLGRDELQGGTITLSNIGSIGGTYMSPVLVVPEVVIGALGGVRLLPRFDGEGKVVGKRVMNVSWSGDHRVVDGATIARFHAVWKGYIEQPQLMLTELK